MHGHCRGSENTYVTDLYGEVSEIGCVRSRKRDARSAPFLDGLLFSSCRLRWLQSWWPRCQSRRGN
jgi:hypothetical protein